MRQHAEKRAAGRILFHHELTEMSQSDDAVTATIRDRSSGETFTVTADYLVGADGGKTIGQMIGATMVGAHDLLDIVTAHLKADLSPWWEDDVLIAHFINPEAGSYPSGGNMVQMGPTWGKHSEEWAFHFAFLPTDDSDLDEQAISAKIRELLGSATCRWRSCASATGRCRVRSPTSTRRAGSSWSATRCTATRRPRDWA